MKIITYLFEVSNGRFSPSIGSVDENGTPNSAINFTMIEFIELLDPELRKMVMTLLTSHEAGTYHPEHPEWADFGINDINMWIREPFVERGYVLISNENVEEYSEEYGTPQRFTVAQFRQVMACWEEFLALVNEKGKAALAGKRFEKDIV